MEGALNYALTLQGVPYRRWVGEEILPKNTGPFYAISHAPLPTHGQMAKEGMSCTGLINLMRRYNGLTVPDCLADYPGGTGSWWEFLMGSWQTFDPASVYPRGSLLFRPYRDIYDQGHAAVLLDDNIPACNSRLLHCYDPVGVMVDDKVSKSHSWFQEGYYQYVAFPECWLVPRNE